MFGQVGQVHCSNLSEMDGMFCVLYGLTLCCAVLCCVVSEGLFGVL
jgi:hypothetical protein